MKKHLLIPLVLFCFIFSIAEAQHASDKILAGKILADTRLDTVQFRALKLLSGFSAGTSYNEVWIRDFNTFINGSLQVHPGTEVKSKLLMFFRIQGSGGDIVDGVVDSAKASVGYQYRYSPLLPGWAAHKNTVETDQESSLIQAVKKYIDFTGDKTILDEKIAGRSVLQRMEDALIYLQKERWSVKYGLVTGATTIDWGDVQSETGWGVTINDKTKWTLDIYDNAMFVKAVHDFLSMAPRGYKAQTNWSAEAAKVTANVRKYLWDPAAQKYIPHIYLNGSPFSPDFNEKDILYTGGSICAVIAGFNTPAEVLEINKQMLAAAAKENHATIGITVYPPYPEKEYPNMKPYNYQNAGDWTWFGGRMIAPLVSYGHAQAAYAELLPMLDRVIVNKGFFEWYDVRTGAPKGSGDFRGEAGVLYDAITVLKQWAVKNR
ncbi:MAG: hypothetical protein JWO06_2112 [Bacteroidota bacterium]|nr:hypothetical protein [Bacteroidota bacterium]